MKNFLQYLTLIIFLISSLQAAPARAGLHTFTQPDGTKFQGYLKGDAAFHWIESDAQIVLLSPKDKFYYNALIDADNTLVVGGTKPKTIFSSRSGFQTLQKETKHKVSQKYKEALKMMQNKAHTGIHPR